MSSSQLTPRGRVSYGRKSTVAFPFSASLRSCSRPRPSRRPLRPGARRAITLSIAAAVVVLQAGRADAADAAAPPQLDLTQFEAALAETMPAPRTVGGWADVVSVLRASAPTVHVADLEVA